MNTFMKIFLLISTILFSMSTFAQSNVDAAISLAEEGAFRKAIAMIEPLLNGVAKNDARAWYVAGYSHKERYKEFAFKGTSTSPQARSERSQAVKQLTHALKLDKQDHYLVEGEISQLSNEALGYLAKTYMNDAVRGIKGFQEGNDDDVLAYFHEFTKIRGQLNSAENWISEEVEIEKNLAKANRILLESASKPEVSELFERVVGHYMRAIELDGNDYASRYNLAINLYNMGVRQLKSIDHTTSMFELMEIQDVCVALFQRSLDPMLAAHKMDPHRLETLKGLMTIYKALSEDSESEKYKQSLGQELELRGGKSDN